MGPGVLVLQLEEMLFLLLISFSSFVVFEGVPSGDVKGAGDVSDFPLDDKLNSNSYTYF